MNKRCPSALSSRKSPNVFRWKAKEINGGRKGATKTWNGKLRDISRMSEDSKEARQNGSVLIKTDGQ